MAAIARSAALIAMLFVLAACKMTLTNRIDVNGDGSALVHVVTTVDDQMYTLAQSQSKGTDPFAQTAPTPGWQTTRRVLDNGDHVIEWTKRASSLSDVEPVLASFYADATRSSGPAKSVPGMSPASWKFETDQKPGLFTRTVHIHASVPKLLPDTKPSRHGDSSQQFGEELARSMMASILTVNTEIELPGKITSSNGEQLADGRVRFTHSLTAPSSIDLTAEVTDSAHVVMAIVAVVLVLAVAGVLIVRRRGGPAVPAAG
jgi:hypothetical protein